MAQPIAEIIQRRWYMNEWLWSISRMMVTGEKPKNAERNFSQCLLVNHKFHMDLVGRNWRNLVSETSIVLHKKFLLVLTRVLVHRCRIRGQESRFDNFEHVSYAQNVKVVTGRLLTQKTQTWERLLMCCVRQRHRAEDTGGRKCRGWVVPVCNMKACSGQKGIAPFILNGWNGWGECKHHAPAVLH
jgi:hypothetical protein